MTVSIKTGRLWPWLVAMVALGLIGCSLTLLLRAEAGVMVEHSWLDSTPVTVFRPADELQTEWVLQGERRNNSGLPVVLISHGFAGSQQLMESFAFSLARNGFLAVTFDYFGHGSNLEPLRGNVTEVEGATQALLQQTRAVADFALGQPDASTDFALLGHSMASDIIVRYERTDARVGASVAISLFSREVTADAPRNLLVIAGGFEGFLKDEALRVVGMVREPPEVAITVGDFANGSARRAVFAPGVEHVGVLYSPTSLRETVEWLKASFGLPTEDYVNQADDRGWGILMLLAGLVMLAWPLSQCLPRVVSPAQGLNPGWRTLLPGALIPAILTPLLLVAFPADFMGVLVGGYLAVHFALYGLITGGYCLWRRQSSQGAMASSQRRWVLAMVAALLAALYAAGLFGWAMDRFVTSFMVTAPRWPLLALMLGGTLIYFLADEWLTRGPDVPRGAHLLTRFCFLLSLGLAVALSFQELFFLLIIAVVIIPYFLIYGLTSGWVYRATGDPLVSALPSAVAFGWALAVVFPQLSGG
ncbi:MAG: alpha/beta hydrolase [Pseudomonadota bacterium]